MKNYLKWVGSYLILTLAIAIGLGSSAANAMDAMQLLKQGKEKNLTTLSYSPGHGTQVEYLSSSGRAYLWYPGNTGIVKGRYKVDKMTLPLDRSRNSKMVTIKTMCFKYGLNTYNPVTKQRGGAWECIPYSIYADETVDVTKGDIFRLSKRRQVPYVLGKKKASFSRLLKKCNDCR